MRRLDDQLGRVSVLLCLHRCYILQIHSVQHQEDTSQKAAQVLIQALVISRLDYCNSLVAALPANTIWPLQLIKNAAARLVFNLPESSHTNSSFAPFPSCQNMLHDISTGLPCCKEIWSILNPRHGQTIHCSISTWHLPISCYSLTAKWNQVYLKKEDTPFCWLPNGGTSPTDIRTAYISSVVNWRPTCFAYTLAKRKTYAAALPMILLVWSKYVSTVLVVLSLNLYGLLPLL